MPTRMSEVNYNDGDVVWVKLPSFWWPGEVKEQNNLPPDVASFKKPPFAIVKLFNENTYEFVKSSSSIAPYNCKRKLEFIKNGMAGFYGKVKKMQKFPKDVIRAEVKTDGNPNILNNYNFSIKRSNSDGEGKGPNKKRKTGHITHKRFTGQDDYTAVICPLAPPTDFVADFEDKEIFELNQEPNTTFTCQKCKFATKRLNVMVLHTKKMHCLRRLQQPVF